MRKSTIPRPALGRAVGRSADSKARERAHLPCLDVLISKGCPAAIRPGACDICFLRRQALDLYQPSHEAIYIACASLHLHMQMHELHALHFLQSDVRQHQRKRSRKSTDCTCVAPAFRRTEHLGFSSLQAATEGLHLYLLCLPLQAAYEVIRTL